MQTSTLTEQAAMERALVLAASGVRGANPLVGAVLLDPAGAVLGEGFHRGAGTDHAETAALADARARGNEGQLQQATMVVTLEPCNHSGRTGPCTAAIAAAGLRRVVFAATDPNPRAAGGAWALHSAGVEVLAGLLARQAVEINRRWAAAIRQQRPFVTLKTAQSLDGRIAAADGSSQWITGQESRSDGHRIRRRADAVLIGTGTVFTDNPRLTARKPDGMEPDVQPLRVAMGTREVPAGAAMRGGRFLQLHTRDAAEALDALYQRGVRHLMIEGGPRTAAGFLAAGLVDEIFMYQAPLLLGDGPSAVSPFGIHTLADAARWEIDPNGAAAVTRMGPDLRVHLAPAEGHTTDSAGSTGDNL
jgi:diaminohydroxyphosphoribosylaminopyrimidine deaminase/5-amino-6-(5-phosphoribosylamino)uracil reductase